MIDRYDLYDMTAVLVNLRSDIANPQNVLIISNLASISQATKNKNNIKTLTTLTIIFSFLNFFK